MFLCAKISIISYTAKLSDEILPLKNPCLRMLNTDRYQKCCIFRLWN